MNGFPEMMWFWDLPKKKLQDLFIEEKNSGSIDCSRSSDRALVQPHWQLSPKELFFSYLVFFLLLGSSIVWQIDEYRVLRIKCWRRDLKTYRFRNCNISRFRMFCIRKLPALLSSHWSNLLVLSLIMVLDQWHDAEINLLWSSSIRDRNEAKMLTMSTHTIVYSRAPKPH